MKDLLNKIGVVNVDNIDNSTIKPIMEQFQHPYLYFHKCKIHMKTSIAWVSARDKPQTLLLVRISNTFLKFIDDSIKSKDEESIFISFKDPKIKGMTKDGKKKYHELYLLGKDETTPALSRNSGGYNDLQDYDYNQESDDSHQDEQDYDNHQDEQDFYSGFDM